MNTKKRHTYSSIERREMWVVYLMLAPALICLTLFVTAPVVMSVYKSFFEWNFYTDSVFVGFENFRIILDNEYFRQSVYNVLKFVMVLVPGSICITFLFAGILKQLSSGYVSFVKSAIYLPGIMSSIILTIMLGIVFDYRGGILNQIIRSFGEKRIAFLSNKDWAFWSVVIVSLWTSLGGGTIIMYAALTGIPNEYYEAASVDGAGMIRKMFHITLPQMKNIFILQAINGVAGTLQMLDLPMFLTGGGPLNLTLTPMLYIYNNFRERTKTMGYTIAGSLLVMIVIALINSVVFKLVKSEKTLDG